LDSRENTVAGGTAWERIAKLVDMSDKAVRSGRSDKTAFRATLMSLRKDEKVCTLVLNHPRHNTDFLSQAPGASGY